MAQVHLVEGPVGAGKSTYAQRLSLQHRAPHIDLDDWMVTLFSPDRPEENFVAWYQECKRRCLEQIVKLASSLNEAGVSAVLELGLVSRAERAWFYSEADALDLELSVYVLDVPEEERWRRVQARNEGQASTYKMVVSEEIFRIANAAWEAPDEYEIREQELQFVSGE